MSRRQVNILLLGETGVGKSTFINSLANYLKYDKITDAKREFYQRIPTIFRLIQHNLETVTICTGKDINEDQEAGCSATLNPFIYTFSYNENVVNIIDTPGFSNTKGFSYDQQNTNKIISFIKPLHHINAICIVLKSTESRLNVSFNYCINSILAQLNYDIKKNVVFIFTHARGSSYRIGDVLEPLKLIFASIAMSPKVFTNENTFLFDNECFRYLAAQWQNVQFNVDEKQTYEESWQRSWQECRSYLDHILTLNPSPTDIIISIRDSNSAIIALAEPLIQIMFLHEQSIAQIKEDEEHIMQHQNSIDYLENRLYVPIIEYRTTKKIITDKERGPIFDISFLLSTVPGIKSSIKYKNTKKIHVEKSIVPYETKKEDASVKSALLTETKQISTIKRNLEEIKKMKQVYIDELNIIIEVAAIIAVFLKQNAVNFSKDPFEECIQLTLDVKRKSNESSSFSNYLGDLLLNYKLKKNGYQGNITSEDVNTALKKLLQLKHAGPPLRQLYYEILE